MAVPILSPGARMSWVICSTTGQFTPVRDLTPIVQEAEWCKICTIPNTVYFVAYNWFM
jgi:hypothetical protein